MMALRLDKSDHIFIDSICSLYLRQIEKKVFFKITLFKFGYLIIAEGFQEYWIVPQSHGSYLYNFNSHSIKPRFIYIL